MSNLSILKCECGCRGPLLLRDGGWCTLPDEKCAIHSRSNITEVYRCGCYIEVLPKERCYDRHAPFKHERRCAFHQRIRTKYGRDAMDDPFRVYYDPRCIPVHIPACRFNPDANGNPILCDYHAAIELRCVVQHTE